MRCTGLYHHLKRLNVESTNNKNNFGGDKVKLRKDDPVYYKVQLKNLIQLATDNGLTLNLDIYTDCVAILLENKSGEKAGISIPISNKSKKI